MGGISASIQQSIQQQQDKRNQTVQDLMNPADASQVDPNFGNIGQPSGKGGASAPPPPTQYSPPDGTMGGKGQSTNSATSGQPRMGQPNNYANTIPQWDNASQQMAQPAQRSGKGKGG